VPPPKAFAIAGGDVELAARDGRIFSGYRALPQGARRPGVLLLTEMFGVTGPMRAAADGFARAGYPTLAPNLFWRVEPPGVLAYEGPERAQAWDRLRDFDEAGAVEDMGRAAERLRAEPSCSGPIAAVGFCMGGRLAVLAALELGVDAAVSYYGLGISRYGDRLAALTGAVQLHYGLADEHVPAAEVEAVTRAAAADPHVAIFGYPDAGHSFCNAARPMYDPAAAALAHARTLALLEAL
jgi:carboxymethylenebutenolidase